MQLLRPGQADLSRRWLAALLLVPEDERGAVVRAVEERLGREYAQASLVNARLDGVTLEDVGAAGKPPPDPQAEEHEIHVVYPARAADGHTEQVVKTYAVVRAPERREVEEMDRGKRMG